MIKSQFIQIETVEVNLLAHKTGKLKELCLISGMSQSECSNKVIGFFDLVSFMVGYRNHHVKLKWVASLLSMILENKVFCLWVLIILPPRGFTLTLLG